MNNQETDIRGYGQQIKTAVLNAVKPLFSVVGRVSGVYISQSHPDEDSVVYNVRIMVERRKDNAG